MKKLIPISKIVPAKAAFSLLDEFKNFAFKGNVIDLAVGVIIGGAFGKIIDSFVKQIIMPSISLILPGKRGYLEWKIIMGAKEIPYGLFIGEVVNFIIIALVLFLFIVKILGWLMKARKAEATAEAKVEALVVASITKDQELLTEIRDLLKNR